MKLDFLQIGFQKCGTTFLDRNVYPTNQEIVCVQAANYLDLEKALLCKLIFPDGLEYDQASFQEDFVQICSKLFGDMTCNGIMFEPFTFVYQRRFCRKNVIDRIKALYPNIKIITFIRGQDSWFLSHYSQYLRSGGLLSLHDFVEYQLNNLDLDAHYIDWYPLISYLYDSFGTSNVLVCLFEELKISPQGVADKIFSFLNVPTSKISSEEVNTSLSSYSMKLRRLLNYLVRFDSGASSYSFRRDIHNADPTLHVKLLRRFIYSFYKPLTNVALDKIDGIFMFKKKFKLEDEQLHKIVMRYGKNNKALSELLSVKLEEFGYPVT